MAGTRGSGIGSSAADVIWMIVLRGMRGVGEVYEMCMCLARGGVGGEGVYERIGFGLYQYCENRGSVAGGEWLGGLDQVWWRGFMSV